MVRHGDASGHDLVKWVVNATFLAEQPGVAAANAIAQTLAMKPKSMLFNKPMFALDPEMLKEVPA